MTHQSNQDGYAPLYGMLDLMRHSKEHSRWSVADFSRLVIPPLTLGQFSLWYHEDRPIAGVTWAFLTDAAGEGYVSGTRKIQPHDWNAGKTLWVIDFLAPYGGVRALSHVLLGMFNDLPECDEVFWSRRKKNDPSKRRVLRYGRSNNALPTSAGSAWQRTMSAGVH